MAGEHERALRLQIQQHRVARGKRQTRTALVESTARSVAVAGADHKAMRFAHIVETHDTACIRVALLGYSDRVREFLSIVWACGTSTVDVRNNGRVNQKYLLHRNSC